MFLLGHNWNTCIWVSNVVHDALSSKIGLCTHCACSNSNWSLFFHKTWPTFAESGPESCWVMGAKWSGIENLGQSIYRDVDLTCNASVTDALETSLCALPYWPWAWGQAAFCLWSLRGKLTQIYSVGAQEHYLGTTLPGSQGLVSESRTWSPQASAIHLGPLHSWWGLVLGSADLLGAVWGLCMGSLPPLPC